MMLSAFSAECNRDELAIVSTAQALVNQERKNLLLWTTGEQLEVTLEDHGHMEHKHLEFTRVGNGFGSRQETLSPVSTILTTVWASKSAQNRTNPHAFRLLHFILNNKCVV
eukprot:m.91692 g.91692  ORF g.91692 m.91692 type:complete len:111 (+) comp13316_c0_seq1:68-400(+)